MKPGDIVYSNKSRDKDFFCVNSLTVFMYMGKDRVTGADAYLAVFDLMDSFYNFTREDDPADEPYILEAWGNCISSTFGYKYVDVINEVREALESRDLYVEDNDLKSSDSFDQSIHDNLEYSFVDRTHSTPLAGMLPFTNAELAFNSMLAASHFERSIERIYFLDEDPVPHGVENYTIAEYRDHFREKVRTTFLAHTSELTRLFQLKPLNPPTISL